MILEILSGGIIRRLKGGGIIEEGSRDPIPRLRRFGSPFLLAALIMVAWTDPWVFVFVALGFFIIDWVGTGEMFAVLHGWFDGVINYSIWNKWIYKSAEILAGGAPISGGEMEPELKSPRARHNAKWGFWVATLRGSYKLATSIPLAILAGNPLLALWGLLGLLDGVIYYTAGRIGHRFKFKSVAIAEYASGGVYGAIIAAIKP